ncbi:MAG TPA: hypothetical protein VGR35_19090 [Tepidisphaeraceae bacterium]|nr:hypothetical protein [Tepidisphaeraceae bacterium]
MSESTRSGHGSSLDYHRRPGLSRTSSLTRIGGALGVAGTFIGFAIFVFACAGYDASFKLSPIPLVFGFVGLVLTLIGGFFSDEIGMEDPQVVACYAINIAVIAGAMLEFAIWRGWPIFYR